MKIYILILIIFTTIFTSFAQVTLKLYDENNIEVSNTTRKLTAETNYHLKVKNTGSSDVTVIFEITKISLPNNTAGDFGVSICFFGACSEPTTTTGQYGPKYTIAAGETYYNASTDHITYQSNEETGSASFEITIREETNETNSVTYTFDTKSSLNTLNPKKNISLYPNPTTDYFTVKVSNKLIGSNVILTNILGKTILKQKIRFSKLTFLTNNFDKGLYFLSIIKNNKIVETKKLIIK